MTSTGNGLEALAMATSSLGNSNGNSRTNHSATSPNPSKNRNNSNARSSNESAQEKNGEASANKRIYDQSQQLNFPCPTPNSYVKNMMLGMAAAQWTASDPST